MTAVETTTGDYEVLAETEGMEREEWLAERRRGIGGSDAAAIAGVDTYRSTYELWLDKIGAPVDDDGPSEPAYWGTRLEDIVRDEVHLRTGMDIVPDKKLLAATQRPWQLANLDGWARARPEDVGVYEGKTAGHWAGQAWEHDEVPDAYLLQGMHYLAVTGAPWLLYGVLIGGQRLEIRRVERDQELIDHLITIEADFWHMVTEKIPPPVDGSKACTDLLAHLWDVKPDAVATLDPGEVLPIIEERQVLAEQIKAAETRKAELENQLKLLINEHEEAIGPDGRRLFSWKWVESQRLDAKALRESHPDIAEAFTKPTGYRRLHIPKDVI